MGSRKKKYKQVLPFKELPRHLKLLADMIEKRKLPILDSIVKIDDISSFKLSLKYRKYEDIVKTKIIIEPTGDSIKEDVYEYKTIFMDNRIIKSKPSYKKLKKSMDNNFKHIKNSIEFKRIPSIKIATDFYKECELMTLYTKNGEDYYEDFLDTAKDLYDSIKNEKIQDAVKSLKKLDYIQNECHKLYK